VIRGQDHWIADVSSRALPNSGLAKALAHTRKRWPSLVRYLDDGLLPIDNNPVERTIRPIAVGRKNWPFAGSKAAGERAAAIMSLIATARQNGHEPYAYLNDVLTRLPTHPNRRIAELLPHRWLPAARSSSPLRCSGRWGRRTLTFRAALLPPIYIAMTLQVSQLTIVHETRPRPVGLAARIASANDGARARHTRQVAHANRTLNRYSPSYINARRACGRVSPSSAIGSSAQFSHREAHATLLRRPLSVR
jgi:hypothetical protein